MSLILTHDFYYDVEDLQTPPMMDDDTLANLQLPILQSGATYHEMLLPNVKKTCQLSTQI
jgi:hypothetical protein